MADQRITQELLDLLNPLHGSLDQQVYDEKHKDGREPHPDDEYAVTVTCKQEADLHKAVRILEKSAATPQLFRDFDYLAGFISDKYKLVDGRLDADALARALLETTNGGAG